MLNQRNLLYVSVLVAMLIRTTTSQAATRFTFVVESEGTYTANHRGTIISDGGRWRIDFEAGDTVRAHDSVIGGVGSEARIALNHSNQTWYYLEAMADAIYVPSLFDFYLRNPSTATNVRIEATEESAPSRGLTVSFRFNVESSLGTELIRGDVFGRVTVLLSETIDSNTGQVLRMLNTGVADVDSKLRKALMSVSDGGAARWEMTITRTFEGGQPMTQKLNVAITRSGDVKAQPDAFNIPGGYQNQAPQIGTTRGQP